MGFLSILFHSLFNSPEPISNKSPSSNTFSGTFSEYEQIYSIEFDSNLNYSNYIFSGKFSKTGKMRTKRRPSGYPAFVLRLPAYFTEYTRPEKHGRVPAEFSMISPPR